MDERHVIVQLSSPIVGCNEASNYYLYPLGEYEDPVGIESAESAFFDTGLTPNIFTLSLEQSLTAGQTYIVETRNMCRWENDIEGGSIGNPCQGTIVYFTPEYKKKMEVYALTNNQSIIMRYGEAVAGMYERSAYTVTDSSGRQAAVSQVVNVSDETGTANTVKINFTDPLDVDTYTVSTPDASGIFRVTLKLSPVRTVGQKSMIIQLSGPIVGCTAPDNYTVRDIRTGATFKVLSAESAFAESGQIPNTFKLTFYQNLQNGIYQIETKNMQLWKDGIENSVPGEPCQGTMGYITVDFAQGESEYTEQEKEEQRVIEAFISQYITPSMSDFEKEMQIIQWMVENIKYDTENRYPKLNAASYGVLVCKAAVCNGYAEAFDKLAAACGLTSCFISGKADGASGWGGHAWNQIQLDGEWYNVDVTWEDPIPKGPVPEGSKHNDYGFGNLSNTYINVTDSILKADHQWESEHTCTSEKYGRQVVSYYLKHGEYKSHEELQDEDFEQFLTYYTRDNQFFYPGDDDALYSMMMEYFESAILERRTSVKQMQILFKERLEDAPRDSVRSVARKVQDELNRRYGDILENPLKLNLLSSSLTYGRYIIKVPSTVLEITYKVEVK